MHKSSLSWDLQDPYKFTVLPPTTEANFQGDSPKLKEAELPHQKWISLSELLASGESSAEYMERTIGDLNPPES